MCFSITSYRKVELISMISMKQLMWYHCVICQAHCSETVCNICSTLFKNPLQVLGTKISVYYLPSECCVCFEMTNNTTCCKHPVCKSCLNQINTEGNGLCPLCRTPNEETKNPFRVARRRIGRSTVVQDILHFIRHSNETVIVIIGTPYQENYYTSHLAEHLLHR